MPEWADHVRARLASLSLSPTREAEIIEELSEHLDQRYEELRADGASDAEPRFDERDDRDGPQPPAHRGRKRSAIVVAAARHHVAACRHGDADRHFERDEHDPGAQSRIAQPL